MCVRRILCNECVRSELLYIHRVSGYVYIVLFCEALRACFLLDTVLYYKKMFMNQLQPEADFFSNLPIGLH